ncbi:MAG TPA: MIT C-terminal domain-containing protein [Actinomycetaceae bacterium]|nr:MIT C-terminal domain-containing protein [Actinomycetaceae bacterium]
MPAQMPAEVVPQLFEGHREFQENQRGVSYETLLMPYLRGATDITIVDPYIRLPHQGRNLVDLLALLAAAKDPADEIAVTLVTKEDRGEYAQQHLLMLKDIQDSAATAGIQFTVTWDETIHDRSIRADHGWKLLLGRGLDIFQKGSGSQYELGSRRQFRMTKTDLRARPMFHHQHDSIHAHLTIVFTALAVARHLQDATGFSIRRLVRALRPLRDVTVNIAGHEITATTPAEGDAAAILDSLDPANFTH